MPKKITLDEFIYRSKLVHNDFYDYSMSEYINSKEKILIICPEHGIFEQMAQDHMKGRGCQKCYGNYKKTTEQFIEESIKVHGDFYDYSNLMYIGAQKNVEIICPNHGTFYQRAIDHIFGHGCQKCSYSITNRKSLEKFILEANEIHNYLYDYSLVNYINCETKVKIICKKHGIFEQIPESHLHNKTGCPSCAKSSYSKVSLYWLDSISKRENIFIQHAENIGEFIIPKTRYKADGYCKVTNTIYEFYGDLYHGNPKVFSPNDRCHPFDRSLTANMLYLKTLERENKIKELGYNLITIWESDYNRV